MDAPPAKSSLLLEVEERVNSFSHALGAGLFVGGLALLAVFAARGGDPWKIVSVCVFGVSLVLLYAASSLYHASSSPASQRVFRVLDHIAIRVLIAGTYTPFLLVNLRGPWGWSLFAIVWGLALAGGLTDLAHRRPGKLLSTGLYVAMGWVILVALRPLAHSLTLASLWLLVAGGLSYTAGAVFYLADRRMPFGHAVWHVFVLGGSVCHFLSVLFGVIPYRS